MVFLLGVEATSTPRDDGFFLGFATASRLDLDGVSLDATINLFDFGFAFFSENLFDLLRGFDFNRLNLAIIYSLV